MNESASTDAKSPTPNESDSLREIAASTPYSHRFSYTRRVRTLRPPQHAFRKLRVLFDPYYARHEILSELPVLICSDISTITQIGEPTFHERIGFSQLAENPVRYWQMIVDTFSEGKFGFF